MDHRRVNVYFVQLRNRVVKKKGEGWFWCLDLTGQNQSWVDPSWLLWIEFSMCHVKFIQPIKNVMYVYSISNFSWEPCPHPKTKRPWSDALIWNPHDISRLWSQTLYQILIIINHMKSVKTGDITVHKSICQLNVTWDRWRGLVHGLDMSTWG